MSLLPVHRAYDVANSSHQPYQPVNSPNFFRSNHRSPNPNRKSPPPPPPPADLPSFFSDPNFLGEDDIYEDGAESPNLNYHQERRRLLLFHQSPNPKRKSEARHVFPPEQQLSSPEKKTTTYYCSGSSSGSSSNNDDGMMDPLMEADSDTEDDPTKLLNQWLGELNTLKKVGDQDFMISRGVQRILGNLGR